MNLRARAALAIDDIMIAGRSLDAVVDLGQSTIDTARDRAFYQEMVYGVVRWYWRLESELEQLLAKPLRARDSDVKHLLMLGLYQLRFMSTPGHAAVDETVKAVVEIKKKWARGLVNGVLRNAIRNPGTLDELGSLDPVAKWSHPRWLIDTITEQWPHDWENILSENNARAPLCLRVNNKRVSRLEYLEMLAQADIEAQLTTRSKDGIRLEHSLAPHTLPGFADGLVSVQDEAAQLAVDILSLADGQRILDACAAPGGKTAHIAERAAPDCRLIAIDKTESRTALIHDNLQRLGLEAELISVDAGSTEQWWDGEQFDRILLDAPCSSTGVIRRHPDIKAHRQKSDFTTLPAEQSRLLRALWPLLKPGGILLYASCSIMHDENDHVIAGLLAEVDTASPTPVALGCGRPTAFGTQILPGEDKMDGFYYSLLHKTDA